MSAANGVALIVIGASMVLAIIFGSAILADGLKRIADALERERKP